MVDAVEEFASRQWWDSSDFVAWRSSMKGIQVQEMLNILFNLLACKNHGASILLMCLLTRVLM